jgi:Zn-dependent M32 family carboxypeptidase
MNEKDLYQQKMQAQLDEWMAKVGILKAGDSKASADVQLEMNRQIKTLENMTEEGRTKLSELAKSSEDAWKSLKGGVESAWAMMKSAVSDATAKFK